MKKSFKEWFIITRDQMVHSRHDTLLEATLAGVEHTALTGDEIQTRKIIHRGLVPEHGYPVSVGWIDACTRHWVLGIYSKTGEYVKSLPIGWHHWLWVSQEDDPPDWYQPLKDMDT